MRACVFDEVDVGEAALFQRIEKYLSALGKFHSGMRGNVRTNLAE